MELPLVNVCCNPYGKHNKPIRKDLRVLNETVKQQFNLHSPLPLYWCSTCRKTFSGSVGLDPTSSHETSSGVADMHSNLEHPILPDKALPSTTTSDTEPKASTATGDMGLDAENPVFSAGDQVSPSETPTAIESKTSNVTAADIGHSPGPEHPVLLVGDPTPPNETQTATEHVDMRDPCVDDEMLSDNKPDNSDLHPDSQAPIGSLLCSLHTYLGPCSGALMQIMLLIKDEKKAICYQARMKGMKGELKTVCAEHYQALVGVHKKMVPTFKNRCCNPFKNHKKRVSTNLRPVKMIILLKAQKKNISLVYGDMICINCVKRLFDQPVKDEETIDTAGGGNATVEGSQESRSSASTNLSPAIRRNNALQSLTAFGVTSFNPPQRSYQGKVRYAQEKLDEVAQISKKKICLVLDLPTHSLESSVPQRAADTELLLEDIKRELPNANKSRKYQLLSLVPLSISINQACEMFNISKSLFKKVRDLRTQQGILPLVEFSRQSHVTDATKKLILDFYCDDENSKLLPGKDDKISISKGVYEQKRLLLCSVEELFSLFKKKHPEVKVGLSIFYKLRPKYCVGAGATGTHKICVCQTHEDVRLLVNALGIKTYYRDLIPHVVCNEESHSCMLRLCENCQTTAEIESFLRREIMKAVNSSCVLDEDDEEFWNESIQYLQWMTNNKQTELVTQLGQRSDVVRKAAEKLDQMIPHEFIARKQSSYVKELKKSLPPNKVVVLMDFAMNFSCIFPSEIQSYHFSKKQVTIHPTVIFHRPEGKEEADYHNLCFISSDLTHDVSMVKVFTKKIVEIIREKFPEVTEVEYLTDGCAAQYKNKISFWNLCQHKSLYQMKAVHSFFASSHGKNLCDALAGLIKRILAMGSLQCLLEEIINSAEKAYEYLTKHSLSEKIKFVFVPKEEVEQERTLTIDSDLLNCVPGTRSFHFYEPQSDTTIGCKRISEMSSFQLVHSLPKVETIDTPEQFEAGSFVVAKINSRKFIGLLTDVDSVEQEAELSLLRPYLPSEVFRWPENLASMVVPLPLLICSVTLCEQSDHCSYKLTDEDRQVLVQKKVIRQKKP